MRLVAIAITLLTASCSSVPGVLSCPPTYRHRPLPSDYRVYETPAYNVPATCAVLGDTMKDPLGCYSFTYHMAIVPTPTSDPVIGKAVELHEECHGRGWPATHPEK